MTMKSLRERLEESVPEEQAFENAKSFGDPAINQGTWLTTSLWNDYAWGLKVKNRGISWTDFMEAYGMVQYSFIQWKRGRKTWDEAMNDFIDELIRSR